MPLDGFESRPLRQFSFCLFNASGSFNAESTLFVHCSDLAYFAAFGASDETFYIAVGVSFSKEAGLTGDFDALQQILAVVAILVGGGEKTVRVQEVDYSTISYMVEIGFADDVSNTERAAIGVFCFVQASATFLRQSEAFVLGKIAPSNGFKVVRVELNEFEGTPSSIANEDYFTDPHFAAAGSDFLNAVSYREWSFLAGKTGSGGHITNLGRPRPKVNRVRESKGAGQAQPEVYSF